MGNPWLSIPALQSFRSLVTRCEHHAPQFHGFV